MTPSSEPSAEYVVIPLSIQQDGDDFLVGSAELDEYYQFDADAVEILSLLGTGVNADGISRRLSAEGRSIDVADFLTTLVDIGFAYPAEDQSRYHELATKVAADKRWTFSIDSAVARAVLSPVTLVLFVATIGAAVVAAVATPAARLNIEAFFTEDHLAITLLSLLVLSSIATAMHEMGHLLAAARLGVRSRIGFGSRLWSIVAEADISGIMARPKRERYLPLLAGIAVDLFNIALLTLVITAMVRLNGDHRFVHLAQALVLQLVVTLTWQLNIFLKTDLYYVLCTWLNYSDLDRDARLYLGFHIARLTGGRWGRPGDIINVRNLRAVRSFTALWIVGRFVAIGTLLLVFMPTMFRYARHAFANLRDPSPGTMSTAYDQIAFVIISMLILLAGCAMWLQRRRTRLRELTS